MSFQAFEAVRDRSESRGATRTVGFVLASHADLFGGSVFPGINTICEEAKVGRKAAIDGRRWFLENGEAIQTGERPSATGSPTPILSFAPLMEKGSQVEPLEGSESEPLGGEKGSLESRKGSLETTKGSLESRKGSLSEPESVTNRSTKSSRDEKALSLSKKKQEQEQKKQQLAREEQASTLTALEAQFQEKPRDATARAIASLREELGTDPLSDLAGPDEVEPKLAAQRKLAVSEAKPAPGCACPKPEPDEDDICLSCTKVVRTEAVAA